MKNDVKPIWEDNININGGCWSFKIFENQASELWEDLSLLFLTNNLLNNSDECVGLSICQKKK